MFIVIGNLRLLLIAITLIRIKVVFVKPAIMVVLKINRIDLRYPNYFNH